MPVIKLTIWLVMGFLMANLLLSQVLHQASVIEKLAGNVVTTSQTLSDNTPRQQDERNLLSKLGSGRHYLWDAAWRMYLEKPFLGWGFGTYHWLYPQYRAPEYGELGQFVHNDYLQFLTELGPIGLLLLLAFVGSLFAHTWRTYQHTVQEKERIIDLGYSVSCMMILFHSILTFNLYQAPMLTIMGLYAGFMSQSRSTVSFLPSSRATALGYYGIVGGLCLFFITALGGLFSGFNSLPRHQEPIILNQTILSLNSAVKNTPYIEEFLAFQTASLVDLLISQPKIHSPEKKKKLILHTLKQNDRAIELNPLRPRNYYNKAMLLSMLPRTSSSQQQILTLYQHALKNNPYYLKARIAYAQNLFSLGKDQQGILLLKQGLDRFYSVDFARAMYFMQLLFEHTDNDDEKKHYQREFVRLQGILSTTKLAGGNFRLSKYSGKTS